MTEPGWVIKQVAETANLSEREAADYVSLFHEIADRYVSDGVFLVAFPLITGQPNNPTWQRIKFAMKDDEWVWPEHDLDAPVEELAKFLHLPIEMLEKYPIVTGTSILVDALDQLNLEDSMADRVDEILQAWLRTYLLPGDRLRDYKILPIGREDRFESWLVDHLDVLEKFGYPIELADADRDGIRGRQPYVSKRLRADLLGRFVSSTGDFSAGDWLVIENKATAVGSATVFQLARYVDLIQAKVGSGVVFGLLIADGITVNLQRALDESGFRYVSVTSLGYRNEIRGVPFHERTLDATELTVPFPSTEAL